MDHKLEQAMAFGGVCLALASFSGCSSFRPTSQTDMQQTKGIIYQYNDLGEGVYTLESDNWPKNLVSFKKEHPELIVTAVYSDQEGGYGATLSYLVVTENREDMWKDCVKAGEKK